MAGIRVGCSGGLLAGLLVHTPEKSRKHGAIRGRSGEYTAVGIPHVDANGKRPFRRRRFRKSLVFPKLAGGGLGQ